MLTPPPSSSSSTSSSPPPTILKAPPSFLSPRSGNHTPPPLPYSMAPGYRELTMTSRPPALYYDEESRGAGAGYREMDAAGWYDSMLQPPFSRHPPHATHEQQEPLRFRDSRVADFRTLQHRPRPVTTIDRSSRVEQQQQRQPLAPLAPLNWEVPPPLARDQRSEIRGRPREIKRGAATVKTRTGSTVPDINRHSLVTDKEQQELNTKKEKEGGGGLRRSARRSLSRSRLIQAVLAVPRRANEGMRWWRDEKEDKSGEYCREYGWRVR